MRAQNWTDVMTLLAVMVASNKLDKGAELALFKKAAVNLRDNFAPHIKLTESFARDWLTENRADIESQATSVHFDASVTRLRKNLEYLAHKSEILTLIMKWTLSDTPQSRKPVLEPNGTDKQYKEWTYIKPALALTA